MEFMFNDLRSQLSWMNTAVSEPRNQQRPSSELADFEALRTELRRRQDWIVQQANTISSSGTPLTRKSYDQRTTSDTDVVKAAGAITPGLGSGGWNSELVLLNSWQVLSGYAHARPWSATLGSTILVRDPKPNPSTGTVTVKAEGDPDRLLDFAFRAIQVVENAVGRLYAISV